MVVFLVPAVVCTAVCGEVGAAEPPTAPRAGYGPAVGSAQDR
ncbi:hypothetical protein KCH_19930 [Kitasatospora cheerisanensis KCTC 2395]|uniref:Uncharacterized protein n=1 Tax=Kitasatospora cheerisanensis KCTC 2395 TaxID=1348663 RepID=A0A066Z7A5_9ACTN|nr:hypothetical protein KCH_19930 [Kitasatospora cheerisanensis KCTC 2395]